VAMFAQRQRWRPAKAFLVDDSVRMLREFTLDSACLVTYDQAVQAGILDAVEKPIKVAKYHGQTVRGDALAVVLLAYGPVTKEQDLRRREEELANNRKAVDELARQIEEDRSSLDRRTGEVQDRAAEIAAKSETVQGREEAVSALEETLRDRDTALATGEAGLQEIRERLATDTSAVQARLEEAGQREEALGRNQENLSNAREKFEADQRELLEFKRSIDSRVSAVEETEVAMDRLSKDLAAREARIAPEESRLAERANVANQK